MLDRTGYRKMLEEEHTPEAAVAPGNLDELVNAAAEAAERGETAGDFLDHAALVSDADAVDERRRSSLLTMHNAKGLEFPVVFLAGMEEGLFPHSRSIDSEATLEEERRLCYVGMTRARKAPVPDLGPLPPAFRRRTSRSVHPFAVPRRSPRDLVLELGGTERCARRSTCTPSATRSARRPSRNMYTGKTYNSLENISQFFAERGLSLPASLRRNSAARPPAAACPAPPPGRAKPAAAAAPVARKPMRAGMTVEHPKYGRGTVVRREGEGDEAKLTVSFPGYGLKKLVEKYAGLKRDDEH